MSQITSLLKQKNLITFVGTGGVGKTSLSLSFAVQAAREGRKVAAITVDPSRRLASIFSDSDNKFENLDIHFVDVPLLFNEFVSLHLSKEHFDRLQGNGIYKQISQDLRETHNFAALYQMYKIFQQEHYDLIILDTPPCHQVIDFFESPYRLQKFFSGRNSKKNSSWLNWVQDKGVQVVEGFVSGLVGTEFVKEMDAFFRGVGELRDGINSVSTNFISTLQSKGSEIMLVFPPSLDKVADARFLISEIQRNAFEVNHFILNRAFIPGLDQGKEAESLQDEKAVKLYNYFTGQKSRSIEMLKNLGEELGKPKSNFFMVPEIKVNLDSRENFVSFSQQVGDLWVNL